MALRYYANAPATALTNSCTALATSITVDSVSGLPITYPYTLIIDRGTASEEAIEVTAAAGTTLTVTRGVDGTTAFAHAADTEVVHGITARDVREPNAHVNADSGVHGVTGDLVGTTDTQTLTNKTISADSNTIGGIAASSFVVTDGSGEIDGAAAQKAVPAGDVVGTTDTQTLSNKTLSSPTITNLDSVGGAWTAFTPTVTNWTLGDGTLVGRYEQIGKTIHFRIELTIGSTTSASGILTFDLPVGRTPTWTAGVLSAFPPVGPASLRDVSVPAQRVWTAVLASSSTVIVTDDSLTPIQPTTPWTWAAGDIITILGTYERT